MFYVNFPVAPKNNFIQFDKILGLHVCTTRGEDGKIDKLVVDFFVFKCAIYLVTLGNFDKMQFKCSSCHWFGFIIASKIFIVYFWATETKKFTIFYYLCCYNAIKYVNNYNVPNYSFRVSCCIYFLCWHNCGRR